MGRFIQGWWEVLGMVFFRLVKGALGKVSLSPREMAGLLGFPEKGGHSAKLQSVKQRVIKSLTCR